MMQAIFTMIGSVAIVTALLYATKSYLDFTLTKNYNTTAQAQFDNGNSAFSILRIGVYLAVALSAIGIIGGDLILQACHGILGLAFIWGAFKISDAILLPDYDDHHAVVTDSNSAVATMMGGYLTATGIIAYSSFVGNGPWWTSLVFFALGQAILLGMSQVYTYTHPKLLENIKSNQLSSGILLGGVFIAFSLILNGAFAGDYVGLWTDIQATIISSIVGIGMMLLFINKVIDGLFVPRMNLTEMIATNNVGATSTIVILKIIMALAIGYVVI